MTANSDPSIRTVPPDTDPAKFPRALAVRIGDRTVWIANRGGVDPEHLSTMGLDPDYIVSVNRSATSATTDHHPLKDGFVNDQSDFNAAVEATRERLQQDGSVIVNCAAGISRSTTVLATAIAAEEDRPLEDVIKEIQEYRERARPHPKLKLNANAYLASIENRSSAFDRVFELADRSDIHRDEDDLIGDLLT